MASELVLLDRKDRRKTVIALCRRQHNQFLAGEIEYKIRLGKFDGDKYGKGRETLFQRRRHLNIKR